MLKEGDIVSYKDGNSVSLLLKTYIRGDTVRDVLESIARHEVEYSSYFCPHSISDHQRFFDKNLNHVILEPLKITNSKELEKKLTFNVGLFCCICGCGLLFTDDLQLYTQSNRNSAIAARKKRIRCTFNRHIDFCELKAIGSVSEVAKDTLQSVMES